MLTCHRDPTFDEACRLEAERVRLRIWANECGFRKIPIFVGDVEVCVRRAQSFTRCAVCDLKREG